MYYGQYDELSNWSSQTTNYFLIFQPLFRDFLTAVWPATKPFCLFFIGKKTTKVLPGGQGSEGQTLVVETTSFLKVPFPYSL